MDKKKIVPVWVSILLILLIVASIVRSIVFIPQVASQGQGWIYVLIKILESLTFVFSLIYCITGYKKNSAIHFKLFCLTYSLYATATIYGKVLYVSKSFVSIVALVLAAITCIALWILTFAKNFGKVKSLSFAITIVACEVLNVFFSLGSDLSYLITLIGKVALAVVFTLMVYAKYLDKTARGTK